MRLLGKDATPSITDPGVSAQQTLSDPRGAQGIAARGPSNFMGNPGMPGAGRPGSPRLHFDPEILQRRLMENAAANRPTTVG